MITAKDLLWETSDGITFGYYDLDPEAGTVIEIEISARVVHTMWTVATNVRHWTLVDEDNELIAEGEAEGLRNARKAVMEALNAHLAKAVQA